MKIGMVAEEPQISVSVDTEKHEDCNSEVLPSPITQLKRNEPQFMVAIDGEKKWTMPGGVPRSF
jgi:hypothetical protein